MVNEDGDLQLRVTEHVSKPPDRTWAFIGMILGMILGVAGATAAILSPLAVMQDRQADRERDEATAVAMRELTESNANLRRSNSALNSAANCRAVLSARLQSFNVSADSYSIELLIEVAEQFDRVLHREPPSRRALQPRIEDARRSLRDARIANIEYARDVQNCNVGGGPSPGD